MTPKDLLEKARHCILQNFEQVQKKRGVGLIKNKHWRASERAALANACFLWVPPFFSVLLQNFGECKGRAPTPFLGFFGILAVLGTFWVSCFLVRPGLLFSYTFFSFCIFCVLFGLASCAKNLLTSFFPSPGLLFSLCFFFFFFLAFCLLKFHIFGIFCQKISGLALPRWSWMLRILKFSFLLFCCNLSCLFELPASCKN